MEFTFYITLPLTRCHGRASPHVVARDLGGSVVSCRQSAKNSRLYFGGDPDYRLDPGFSFFFFFSVLGATIMFSMTLL